MHVTPDEDRTGCRTAALFDRLWETLCDSLGSAATVALLRRSRKRAAAQHPELAAAVVERVGGACRYRLPESWAHATAEPAPALRAWIHELLPFLVELTGPVVVRRLAALPELARWRLLSPLSSPAATRDDE
jgi:hypothetical protein